MEKNKYIFLQKRTLIIILLISLFNILSCSTDSLNNENPKLSIDTITNFLDITMTGYAIDADGTISKVTIDWGDNYIDNLNESEFNNFEKQHRYLKAGIYNVIIMAIDDSDNVSYKELTITVNFDLGNLSGIKESLYKKSNDEYLMLTINLHTYQEDYQEEKFNKLVELIAKMDIDFIALQEVAQNKESYIVDGIIKEDNMVRIISDKLKYNYNLNYNYIWNWAHYGWDIWEEGVSILSKHPLIKSEDRYISTSKSTTEISSRKAIYGLYETAHGKINVFSTHTFWRSSETDQEQNTQMKNIKNMVSQKELEDSVLTSFVCGDFNSNATDLSPWNEGYLTMIEKNEYIDSFLQVNPDANNLPSDSIYDTITGSHPGRIDYIFMKENNHFEVLDSQIVFKDDIVGKISDHYGVLIKVKYK